MPSHVDTPSRIFGRSVGKTTFRSGLIPQDSDSSNLQCGTSNNCLDNLPDQRLRPPSMQASNWAFHQTRTQSELKNDSLFKTTTRTFGLRLRNQPSTSSFSENNFNPNRDPHIVQQKTSSTVSRTYGLVSDNPNDIDTHSEVSNFTSGRNGSISSSITQRTFGLQSKNPALHSGLLSESELRPNPDLTGVNFARNNSTMSVVSRTCGLGSDRVSAGLSGRNNEGYIQDLRRNTSANISAIQRPIGFTSRNLTGHSTFLADNTSALQPYPSYRTNTLKTAGGTSEFDSGGFRKPTLSRVIRGRNSLMTSRLFHNQQTDRHCRDLSNINGFNVSHISHREVATLSESQMGRSNWMEVQSVAGSMLSGASMKAQFMNLLENLHHSIVSIGPELSVENLRVEFEKVKQRLENISETSFAPSVRDADAASVITHTNAVGNGTGTECVIDRGLTHLKSSREVLKTLFTSKNKFRNEVTLSACAEVEERHDVALTEEKEDSDDEEVARLFFKKPKPHPKRSRNAKAKAERPEETKKAMRLENWYPMALGSELALCGVDEGGVTVRTDAVKKRLNNRKVELVSGLYCSLVGNPSTMVSELPKKIGTWLRNGLPERWRMLQKELLACQTAVEGLRKRKSKSPKAGKSPARKSPDRKPTKAPKRVVCLPRKVSPKGKATMRKSKSPKKAASPKKQENAAEIVTRSGRTVKPPSMFWIASASNEITPASVQLETIVQSHSKPHSLIQSLAWTTPETPEKKSPTKRKAQQETPKKKSPTKRKAQQETPTKKSAESPKKHNKKDGAMVQRSPGRPRKGEEGSAGRKGKEKYSPKESEKKKIEEETTVESSMEETKRTTKRGKRKGEVVGDSDSVRAKKSKLEKKTRVETATSRKGKVEKRQHQSPKAKKSPAKNKKQNKKKAAKESEKNEEDKNEFEEDFELQLDDIEIPEIAHVSGNPQLSRSQLRIVSMETPPLKYFNNNLRLLRSGTPIRSPDWCISQRTESEVKRFQKRREGALKKKTRVEVKKTITTTEKTTKTVASRDLNRVMEWVAEKNVRSPAWNSKLLQYVLPSRRKMEEQDEEDEDDEIEFRKPSFV